MAAAEATPVVPDEAAPAPAKRRTLNINVGIMGHVDSGKTSLARALSTTISTAALDKNPQSQERGITLDLGFSSFIVPMPEHMKDAPYDDLQFTLVDCPGHASLIRTIIGGAQIIDMMMLVIDVQKGVQTQTAECLVIGEILMDSMLVVLNKVDLLPEGQREEKVSKMQKGLTKVFAGTKFKAPAMIPTSAASGDISELISKLISMASVPKRTPDGKFFFAVDHCFPIKGQGTVLTGTVLNGSVRVNDQVELPDLKLQKKVKSMQMFKKPVQVATQGDRVGVLVTQLDAKLVERGILCAPGSMPSFSGVIVAVERVRFYKAACPSKRKYHITIGHSTVLATAHFFRPANPASSKPVEEGKIREFDFGQEYLSAEELVMPTAELPVGMQWALLLLDKPIIAPADSLLIGSVLDTDINANSCRLVFFGHISALVNPDDKDSLAKLRIYKPKQKVGSIKRVVDEDSVIGKDLFKKETDISMFINLNVTLDDKIPGYIEGSFGSSGQYKVRFKEPHGLPISKKGRGKGKKDDEDDGDDVGQGTGGNKIILSFKKYMFEPTGGKKSRVQQ